jgi:branched-chain amino acid transport system ATP-binding protein
MPLVPNESLLSVTDLNVFYGGIHALKSVSLQVREGEICTIIGANGAGKSTLLKTISGLLSPASGSITFMCQEITRIEPHVIASMGVGHVLEGRRVFANLTVWESLQVGGFLNRDPNTFARNVDRVFALFPRLKERTKQLAGTLSGGEQQMLAIGRALMMGPRLLLMDEPSLGLAPVLVDSIFEAIQEIQHEGTTILLVEQNAAMALEIADVAYVLETGRVVKKGPAKDLLQDSSLQAAYLGQTIA